LEKIGETKTKFNFRNIIVFVYDFSDNASEAEREYRCRRASDRRMPDWRIICVDQISVWLQHELFIQDAMHAFLQVGQHFK